MKWKYLNVSTDKEALIVENILSTYFLQFEQMLTVKNVTTETKEVQLKEESLDVDPVPSAVDYYGIIEIVLMMSFGMLTISTVVYSERKEKIQYRIDISTKTTLQKYLSKFIPCVLVTSCIAVIAVIINSLLYQINWGNWIVFFSIMFLFILATSSFGILLLTIFKNIAVSIITLWGILFLSSYWGGSFQMYMFADIPKSIMKYSMFYYVNRTLVEHVTMGKCIS